MRASNEQLQPGRPRGTPAGHLRGDRMRCGKGARDVVAWQPVLPALTTQKYKMSSSACASCACQPLYSKQARMVLPA